MSERLALESWPQLEEYASLYETWLAPEKTAKLLALADDLSGKRVLDLCAGGGDITRAARTAGAFVVPVDGSADMAGSLPGIELAAVEEWLPANSVSRRPPGFDVVFCKQAVNYWLTPEMARAVATVLTPGGLFVFNTFNTLPPPTPLRKCYPSPRTGDVIVESSWFDPATNTVLHVQSKGSAFHISRFPWISPENFLAWLSPWFEAERFDEGSASRWRCRLRGLPAPDDSYTKE